MPLARPLLAALLCFSGAWAFAQQMWEWTVLENGVTRRYISDRPPPANLPNVKILRSPAGATRSAAPPTGPVAVPAGAGAAAGNAPPQELPANLPPLPTEDKDLVAKKKQAEAAEAAKQRAVDEAAKRANAEVCARARAGRAMLDSGERVAITKANGEREVLDDAGRAAEMARVQRSINATCN